jgi:hypothetical protein
MVPGIGTPGIGDPISGGPPQHAVDVMRVEQIAGGT